VAAFEAKKRPRDCLIVDKGLKLSLASLSVPYFATKYPNVAKVWDSACCRLEWCCFQGIDGTAVSEVIGMYDGFWLVFLRELAAAYHSVRFV
jgi:hypothetical protein